MNAASPIVAMLWENWRLTRVEAGQRLALGLVAGSAVLTFFDNGAQYAFWILVLVHSMIWFSIAKLNGGKFADGYKPGFPFYLLYTRPVPTRTFVSVAILYDAITCTALYLVSAALLGIAFGKSLPMFSMVLCLVSYHFAYACCQWSTRNRVVQWVGSIVFSWPMFFMLYTNVQSPLRVEFSIVEIAIFVLIGVVAYFLTVAGVERQRRGNSVAFEPQLKAGTGGYPSWLINSFRIPCPTTSATKAQVWFELKSSGLPILMIGLAVSLMIFLLFALGIPVVFAREIAVGITVFCIPLALYAFGSNAFGIRRKQGRTYASSFELTQPFGTAQMAGLKVMVRAACVLVAMTVIGVSIWASSSLLGIWGEWFPVYGTAKNAVPGLLKARQQFSEALGGLSGHAFATLAVIVTIAIANVVAWLAAREALRVRYPRGVLVALWLPVVWAVAVMLMTLAQNRGLVSVDAVRTLFMATFWASGAAIALATIYLIWSGFAERIMTMRYAIGAFTIAAIFGVAMLAAPSPANLVAVLWPVLLILMVGALAPWALSRVRHA